MRTQEQAKAAATAFLAEGEFAGQNAVILESRTQEFPEGWVFFYQSGRFVETGEIEESLLGNAPIFVPRQEVPACTISYHRSVAESMAAFRSCGNANASVTHRVRLVGHSPSAQLPQALQAIRRHTALGIAAARQVLATCSAQPRVEFEATSIASAKELALQLVQLGFPAEVAYDG